MTTVRRILAIADRLVALLSDDYSVALSRRKARGAYVVRMVDPRGGERTTRASTLLDALDQATAAATAQAATRGTTPKS